MKLIKKHYEEGYHENFLYREAINSHRNRARLKLLAAERPTGKLLEVGCGYGGFLRMAAEHFEAHGLEISRSAVDKIRAEFGDRILHGNLERDSLPQRAYDAIAAFNILEHIRNPVPAARKLYDALNGGGVLIGSVPNNSGPVGRPVTRLGNFFDRTHVSTLPPPQWRDIFQAAGFSNIRFFGEITIGRNRCVYVQSPAWWLVSFNLMFICFK